MFTSDKRCNIEGTEMIVGKEPECLCYENSWNSMLNNNMHPLSDSLFHLVWKLHCVRPTWVCTSVELKLR